MATSATGDDNAIDQTITILPNIGRATAAESIVKSVAIYAAAGAAIKSARDPGRLPTDEHRERFSRRNRNNRENAATASTRTACGTANHDPDLRHGVWYFKRLFVARIKKRLTARSSSAFGAHSRHADRHL